MLAAVKAGRLVLPSRFLSSRRSIRLLRLASCWYILVFTRNPFLLVVMVARYNIKHRRIHKGFRVFQNKFAPTSFGFACSRTRWDSSAMVAGAFGRGVSDALLRFFFTQIVDEYRL